MVKCLVDFTKNISLVWITNTIQYNCILIVPSLQSSEVHIEAG